MPKVAIIGGGAAGMACAIAAAREGAEAHVYERADRVGKKLLVTGNGRCNMSNTDIMSSDYNDPEFVQEAMNVLPPESVMAFFEDLGVLAFEEDEGRIYPYSNKAATVLDMLRLGMKEAGVVEHCDREVRAVAPLSRGGWAVAFADDAVEGFDVKLIHYLQFHFNGFFEGEGNLYVDNLCLTEEDKSIPETPVQPETPKDPPKDMSPEKTRITGFENNQWQFDGSDQWNAEASAEIVDGGLDGSKWQKLHYQQGGLHQKYIMGEFPPIDASKCRYITFYAKADQEVTFRIYLQADYKGGHAKVTVKDEGWYSVPLSEWTTTVKDFDTSQIHFLQFHFNGFFEGEGYLYVDGLCLTEGDYSKGEFDTAGEPETPENPEKPENPENPEKPESPDTGAARSTVLPLAALAAGAVLVTVGIRRKNKR